MNIPTNWSFSKRDADEASKLQARLPSRIFDGHAHAYRLSDAQGKEAGLWKEGPAVASLSEWRRHVGRQVGDARLTGGLFFGYPVKGCDIEASNDFIADELARDPDSRGLLLVAPESDREAVLRHLANPRVAGFKPYHVFSTSEPTFESPMADFLPDWTWELAHECGLAIMMHLVRSRSLADPVNQREIREKCLRFPNARLILAHAARGFHAPDTVESIGSLRGLENVWFDSSAICEAAALVAILREFGPQKLMWGTDFPVSELRGKCITIGDGFAWVNPEVFAGEPPLVGLESLRALLDATAIAGLNAADLNDIFHDNALRLLRIDPTPPRVQELYRHAKQRIPGGTQLLSKRPEMFAPESWPAYFREARGCEVWDTDGRHYYDFSINGVGACLLGFRDPDVTAAVQRRVMLGSLCSLNPPEELELADLLCEIHPWAERVRCARSGGEAMSVAVRIARATTDRSVVAVCGYHGWEDWYLAANLGDNNSLRGHLLPGLDPLGVPVELRGTAVPFTYNNREEFRALIAAHGSRLAAVVMEPCRYLDPDDGFLEFVRDEAHKAGALLVFDEITIGWRLCLGGAHRRLGVNPDMAVFAKSLGNGHPMAAVIGTANAMVGAEQSFISSSYWTEGVGPVAALATIRKMQRVDVPAHVAQIGEMVRSSWSRHAITENLPVVVEPGHPCLVRLRFDHEQANEIKTLFTQLMLSRGFLAGGLFFPTLAHDGGVVGLYDQAVGEVFSCLGKYLKEGSVADHLTGPPAHTGFRRLL